ncbi:hypothetical protein [Streptomyces fulvoviolaceus]|uniref:hypothetical protein n=1 Tax=Streptomyces fulvoviolaceus TaxID=285535 RepID=UPI0021C10DF2|nr:hypothetical protein [Streptomyces fulvoviolaceus]MCT9076952.1 hypothetical protein [Streptomyces fulvoviolaceus]
MRAKRAGRWAATAVVPVFAVLWLTVGPRALEDHLGVGVAASDEVPGSKTFAGAWQTGLDEDSDLLSIRLDVLPGARAGEDGATVVSATSDTVCSGRATVQSRSKDTLVLGGFDVRRTGPGASSGTTYDCGLPATMKLVSDPGNGGIMWEQKPMTSVQVDRVSAASVAVPEAFLGDWYDARGSLQITVRPGTAGTLAVQGVDDGNGRHCEWEAALLDVRPTTLATTGAHVIAEESDPACRSAKVSYLYDVEGGGDSATLTRHSNAEVTTLELKRRPSS